MAAGAGPALDLREVSVGFDGAPIIERLTLSVAVGDSVAIVGPNGSGKSTLVRAIVGVLPVLAGEIEFHGRVGDSARGKAHIGYVPQHHSLTTAVRATVTEIVATARLATRPWWVPTRSADRQIVAEAIAAVGLSDRAQAEVASLSGGQQRRVLIARALASESELLIMDEPTAGVDVASQAVLAKVLATLRERGLTMIVVTHELEHLEPALSRVVRLERGLITFDGTPQDFGARRDPGSIGHCHDERPAAADLADDRRRS